MFYHIITSVECNGNCIYCYQKSVDDMEESYDFDIDYDVPDKPAYKMGDLKDFISRDPDPTITFYGGEPLLNVGFIKEVMGSVKARFMMQTNGLLLHTLDKEYVNRFHTILVSLDGDEETTDSYRGRGNYSKVMENIKLIRDNGFGGELIARMTIEEQDIYNSVISLLNSGFTSIHWQLDANFWKHDYKSRDFPGFAMESYNPGISKLINFWVDKIKEGKVLKLYPFLDIVEDLLLGRKTFLRCGSGYTNFTILTNGKIVSCPIMVGMKDFYLGDIRKTNPSKLMMEYRWKEPCNSCHIFDKCGGRCLYSNFLQPWGLEGMKEVCKTVEFLITSLEGKLPEIKELIKNGVISLKDFEHVKYNGAEVVP